MIEGILLEINEFLSFEYDRVMGADDIHLLFEHWVPGTLFMACISGGDEGFGFPVHLVFPGGNPSVSDCDSMVRIQIEDETFSYGIRYWFQIRLRSLRFCFNAAQSVINGHV